MRVCVGQILGAHGVRGLVKLASFTEDPEAVAQYGPLTDEAGRRRFTVALSGARKGHFLARIDEVTERDAAEALAGTRLFVERGTLPPPEADEFYHADLIGLRAERPDGTALGKVAALHNFGAGDIIELVLDSGKRPLLPFDRATVPVVDLDGKRIVVDPPPGLLDSDGDSGAGNRERGMNGAESTRAAWDVTVLTLFPAMFPGPAGQSLAGKALDSGAWRLQTLDIREFARDKHRSVDDTPFGGGAGMVMRPDVLDRAIRAARRPGHRLIALSPRGRLLTQDWVAELSQEPGLTLVCGRFEGVDERVLEAHAAEEMSVGDYVLSGGEPAALVLIDACVRLLPGVMGNVETAAEESFADGLLEYPHYTRPALWRDAEEREWAVPEVLVSGHHEKIKAWRRAEAERLTRERRPDLWVRHVHEPPGRRP